METVALEALVFLYTRHDGHEARLTALKEFQEKEVEEISSWAAQRLREHQRLVAESCQRPWLGRFRLCGRLGGRGEALRRSHAARLQEAQRGLQAARAVAPAPWGGQGRRVAELQGEAVELRRRLLEAEAQVGDDQQWLAKQVALEAWQRRGALERGFEEAQRAAKGEQLVRMEELRAAREARLLELRGHLEEERVRAQGQVEEALQEAVRRQELSFEVERRNLELVQERQAAALHEAAERQNRWKSIELRWKSLETCRNRLFSSRNLSVSPDFPAFPRPEARVEVDAAKAQCQERQRLLDEMSRELQERRRLRFRSKMDGTELHRHISHLYSIYY